MHFEFEYTMQKKYFNLSLFIKNASRRALGQNNKKNWQNSVNLNIIINN